MMRTKSFSLLVCIACMLMLVPAVSAATDSFITSADQYYSVTFDGEGEAYVSLLLEVTNAGNQSIDTLNLEVPSRSVTLLGAAQKIGGGYVKKCVNYDSRCVEHGTGDTCVRYDYMGNCEEYKRPCLKRERECTRYKTDYVGAPTYEKLSVSPEQFSQSTNLPLSLIKPVSEGDSTRVLVMYKAGGFVGPALNGKHFNFETAKLPMTSSKVRVSVTPPDNCKIKGVDSRVNFQPEMVANAIDQNSYSTKASEKLSEYSKEIKRSSGYTESASYLDPHESFTMSGLYAKSAFRMYLGEILVGLLSLGAVLAGLVYGIRKLIHYAREHLKADRKKKPHSFIVPFLGGLLVSFVIVILWCLTIFVIWGLSELAANTITGIFAVVLVILTGLFTLLALAGVPMYVGVRYGGSLGLFTALSAIGWIIVTVVFLFVGFFIISVF